MFTTTNKTVILSVINDLATDQRVLRSANVLKEQGYEVLLFGRELKNSPSVAHLPYQTKRIKMLFTSGPAFYLFFNLRLLLFLLKHKSTLLFANDLDTLWPNYFVAKLRKLPLIYDSHEIFCEVPELQKTPLKKKIWESLEAKIIPKLTYCITVNQSIADYFNQKYKVNFVAVRNIPETVTQTPKTKTQLGMPSNKTILILQGAGINIQRGAEELVEAMQYVDKAHLYIIGGGDVFETLKKSVKQLNLGHKITIKEKMPKSELQHYTFNSDIGISIDKDSNLNYHYSLPNKFFDYTQANLAVLATRLPEIEKLINTYNVGCFINHHEPQHIANTINDMIESGKLSEWKNNCQRLNQENNWEIEKQKLIQVITSIH
ncbi:MAG TPA: glycosyltransferase [Bacteroidia bacterium]|nr:glycosyltransferase [Bacteroidia bacterium]HRD39302.1 glycosyltransferase [Bacteroidia bacterium]